MIMVLQWCLGVCYWDHYRSRCWYLSLPLFSECFLPWFLLLLWVVKECDSCVLLILMVCVKECDSCVLAALMVCLGGVFIGNWLLEVDAGVQRRAGWGRSGGNGLWDPQEVGLGQGDWFCWENGAIFQILVQQLKHPRGKNEDCFFISQAPRSKIITKKLY